ncbi:nucleoside triphosphate pyrophosphohydrolase [Salsuginibacillus kocurii]|uniref:nucleoside triphosphate pyrophosphohydrolase n=1 Tax=Salsuginibacillus kocurii TaxID=427078 RepID=UPI000476FC2F|nr:nucleoside triphosphate pyrophosphohydrolase [Salsuginibacillus kocurii]
MEETSFKPIVQVVGLGPGTLEQIPLGIYRLIHNEKQLICRTKEHPAIRELQAEGIEIESFDELYEAHDEFASVYEAITEQLVQKAEADERPVYAVPGHPLVAEETVQQLKMKEAEGAIALKIWGGQSFLDPIFQALGIDPNDGFQLRDGTSFYNTTWEMTTHLLVTQVYDSMIASDLKLTLLERLPETYEVKLVRAAGTTEERVFSLPLVDLDRSMEVDNLTALYVPPVEEPTLTYRDFSTLREVIQTLRGPGGCPWDKKQTHASLKKYLIEETYEVLEAIDEEDDEHLVEELGDVLLQVMLHAQIGEDEGFFNVEDVIETLTAKMVRRHPHVFGEGTAGNADDVKLTWEAVKQAERETGKTSSVLEEVSSAQPALLFAYELQKKAAKVGFDWGESAPMWEKWKEETLELAEELKSGSHENAVKEYGDVLFVLVNIGRHFGIHPEEALLTSNQKFIKRFRYIERKLEEEGITPEEATLVKMDQLWDQAKEEQRKGE